MIRVNWGVLYQTLGKAWAILSGLAWVVIECFGWVLRSPVAYLLVGAGVVGLILHEHLGMFVQCAVIAVAGIAVVVDLLILFDSFCALVQLELCRRAVKWLQVACVRTLVQCVVLVELAPIPDRAVFVYSIIALSLYGAKMASITRQPWYYEEDSYTGS